MSDVHSFRPAPLHPSQNLRLLGALSGTWAGRGFNLIARPDFRDKTDLYLQLNQTQETITFTPIGSPVPNRGFGQDDINLQGLTYLQKINDAHHGGALHIEPGIWINQPDTSFPPDNAPPKAELVARMATIPHGNSVLAQGIAEYFTGPPILTIPGSQYSFSRFPSFNSTPFATTPTAPPVFNAAGSSERQTAPNIPAAPPAAPPPPFPQYDLTVPIGPIAAGPHNPPFTLNTRTPYTPPVPPQPPQPPLPASIDGVPMQTIVDDPITLLQAEVQKLVDDGYSFKGVVLNIATTTSLTFLTTANTPAGPQTIVTLPQFSGGVENIRFLTGITAPAPAGQIEANAQTATVYATFWIEEVTHHGSGTTFMQLQYAQMVVLNFPIFRLLNQAPPVYVNLGWPHITVATLRKTFG